MQAQVSTGIVSFDPKRFDPKFHVVPRVSKTDRKRSDYDNNRPFQTSSLEIKWSWSIYSVPKEIIGLTNSQMTKMRNVWPKIISTKN